MTSGNGRVADRLKDLGINLPPVPTPLAIYRPAVRTGNLVYISGQLPTVDGKVRVTGHLGVDVTPEQGKEAARIAAINALAAANTLLGSLERCRVIRTVGMVASAADFYDHPQVVNGASELLRDVFGEENGIGVRLAYGIATLPLNSPVEVELLLEVN